MATMENKENLPLAAVEMNAAKADKADTTSDKAPAPTAKAPLADAAVPDANVPAAVIPVKEVTSSGAADAKEADPNPAATTTSIPAKKEEPAVPVSTSAAVSESQDNQDVQGIKEGDAEVVESVDITNAPVTATTTTRPASTITTTTTSTASSAHNEKAKLKPLSPTAEPFVMSGAFTTPRKSPPPMMGGGIFPDTPTSVSGSLPPMTPQRGSALRTPRSARNSAAPSTPVSPHVELTAKQVRELRRLCRKTANRAEYEGRLVQLRQIASILAMGGPSLVHFAPSYLSAHSSMQAWLDASRGDGADWRDERPLTAAAVEELREWDRLLKAWAKRRFPTLADCSDGSAPPTTPRSKRLDLMSCASPMSGAGTPSPARNLVATQTLASPNAGNGSTRRRVSRMSISTDGDTINVSIVRTPDKAESAAGKSPWRVTASPRNAGSNSSPMNNTANQENVNPEGDHSPRDWGSLRKPSPAHADKPAAPVVPLKARNW